MTTPPAGAPTHLVLLHGALGARAQLVPLLAPLVERSGGSLHVHAPELVGHGETPDVEGRPFRIERFADDVAAFLDGRGVERAAFFGYSMGGYVALHLAAERPERVAAVATLGTKFVWDPATAEREAARLDPVTIRAGVPRFADALAARHAGTTGGWEGVLARTAGLLRALGERPLLTPDVLSRIAPPVRVMVGDRDATVSVEESAAVARALPKGELAVLPGTPHPLEQIGVERLARELTDFVDASSA
ncbi:MAG: alpha/beta fold hydrolase [Gemmatimonadaceae bacterium]